MALFTFKYKYKDKEGKEIEKEAEPLNSWSEACWAKDEMEKSGAICSNIYSYQEKPV